MSFCISTINYLGRAELIKTLVLTGGYSQSDIRGVGDVLSKVNYCPGPLDTNYQIRILRLSNSMDSGVSVPIGCIVLGNVESGTIGLDYIRIDGVDIGTPSGNSYTEATKTLYDKHVSTNHLKSVPVYLDQSTSPILLNPGSTLEIRLSQTLKLGYVWIGNLYKFNINPGKPTKSELTSVHKVAEYENGDQLREVGISKKSITCSFPTIKDEDTNFILNSLHNGDRYYLAGFIPSEIQENKAVNISNLPAQYTQAYYDDYIDRFIRWREHSGFMVLNSPNNLSASMYPYFSTTLNFTEVM